MAGEWRETTLGQVIELKRGYDLPSTQRRPGSIPIVSSSGESGSHDVAMVPGPGVVTGRYGTIGEVFYVDRDFWPLNTTLYVRDFKESDPRFVSYFLKTLDFLAFSDKAAVPGINRNHLHEAVIQWPSNKDQQQIAELLGVLDDKIDLNRRMAETLEATARALFKSWFVDFDPVRAKAEGRPTSLPDALAALFPDRLTEEGLPEGWNRQPLTQIVAQDRETIEPAALRDAIVDHFSLPAFDAGRRPTTEAASAIKSLKLNVSAPVVLFSKLNPDTPRVWAIHGQAPRPMLASTEFLALRPISTQIPFSFVEGLLASHPFRGKASGMVTGTSKSHQRIQPAALLATEWSVPPQAALAAFDGIAGPSLRRRASLGDEISTLADLRDALLPKLISGELRIRDAERAVAAA